MCNYNEEILKKIIYHFYSSLAHEKEQEGLEKQLDELAGAANGFAPEESLFDSIQTFLEETAGVRKKFYSQEGDLRNLLNEAKNLNNEVLLSNITCIYNLHKIIKEHLNNLEKYFLKALNGKIDHRDIVKSAIGAGKNLVELLGKRDELLKEE